MSHFHTWTEPRENWDHLIDGVESLLKSEREYLAKRKPSSTDFLRDWERMFPEPKRGA